MPMAMARRQLIHSPRKGPASRATVSGVRNPMVVVWSRRKWRSARKLKAVDDSSKNERTIWILNLLVRRRRGTANRPSATTIATNCPRKRIHTARAAGIPTTAARYLAVASRQAKRTQAAHMRAIALSGRETIGRDGAVVSVILGIEGWWAVAPLSYRAR